MSEPGTSRYRIGGRIGEGGMGVVYRAEDTTLRRKVALKFLPEGLTHSEELRLRFLREARIAAALNHPNICTIHEVGEVGSGPGLHLATDEGPIPPGTPFIVLELVEGTTLRAILEESGPLALARIFDISVQIAEGLAAAHGRGVVHRDLKPQNVMLTPEGRVKLLDFGLAKVLERAQPEDHALADLESFSAELTVTGQIMGTAARMSPEQALGKDIDSRSDIFSFGIMLYEMSTGRRPFEGESAAATVAKILESEPRPPREMRPDLPPELEQIIDRCLQKRPDDRYADARALLVPLRDLQKAAFRPAARGHRSPARALAAVLILLLATAGLWVLWRRAGSLASRHQAPLPFETARLSRLTAQPGLEDQPSWSPDGRSILFVTDEAGRLGMRSLDHASNQRRALGSPQADEVQPVFSPDGARIAFVSSRDRGGRLGIFMGFRAIELYVYGQNGDLFVMPARGGEARKVFENAYDPDWSPDGGSLACRSIRDGTWRVWIVPLDGTPPRPIEGAVHAQRMLHPAWSPDGRWIAYVGSESAARGWDLFAAPVAGGPPIQLTEDRATVALEPVWTRDGRWIVFSSNRHGAVNLWSVAFDPGSPGIGKPQRVTTGIGEDLNPALSRDGKSIAYSTLRTSPDIWIFTEADGSVRKLTSETTIEDYPRLSPDGTHLLFYSDRSGREEVWSMHLETGRLEQMSDDGGTQNAWSPDGAFIAYGTKGGLVLVEVATRRRTRVAEEMVVEYPDFSPDSRRVAFQGHSGRGYRLYVARVPEGVPEEIPTPQGVPGNPSWSHDGTTLFFQLDQLGYRNVWALDLERGLPRQLTSGNIDDAHPDVSPDGRRVLFLRHHRDLFTVPAGGGEPVLLYSLGGSTSLIEWPAWTPDGRGVVFSVSERTGDLFRLDAGGGRESRGVGR